MIYVDTSVVLAHLLAEDRAPPASLWDERLVSSRLLEYELWVRLHGRGLMDTHEEPARAVLARLAFLEMIGPVLERARQGFPAPIRTLDALHLASAEFLQDQGTPVRLASYDQRMLMAARALKMAVYPV